jgi:ribonuclease HI
MSDSINVNNSGAIIFTDGACIGNPGPGGWAFVLKTSKGHIIEQGGAASATTNNRMELNAIIQALVTLDARGEETKSIAINTDSQYAINGITKWVRNWKIKDWVNGGGEEVKNRDLWEKLDEIVSKIKKNSKMSWQYVRGHVGIAGNERCDEIALASAEGRSSQLFEGDARNYSVDLLNIKPTKAAPAKSKMGRGKNVYYLSYYGGDIFRDKTWAECEGRVKGRSGVKFKKVSSEQEERQVLESWGVKKS